MNVKITSKSDDIHSKDIIIIPLIKGEMKKLEKLINHVDEPWAVAVRDILLHRRPESRKNAIQFAGSQKVIVLGLEDSLSYQQISNQCRSALFNCIEKNKQPHAILVVYDGIKSDTASALANGMRLSNIRIDYYAKERSNTSAHLNVWVQDKKSRSLVEQGIALAEIQEGIGHLVNMPSNEKNPQFIVDWVHENLMSRSITIHAMGIEDLKEKGMGGLVSVGQGSKTPPYLLIIEYRPTSKQKLKHIGLVGKGVTFDTGGISLKDSLNMHLMKSDMGGAAAVLGALQALHLFNIKINATAVIPLAENAIGPEAYRPGDVYKSYSGKSVEVIDTDAEGRLILADALTYIVQEYQTDHLIDLATLTGSIIMTLGYRMAGLFSNDDALAKALRKTGDKTGERLWQLPLSEDYAEEMNSDIADIKNLSTKPGAGAITAAKFLEAFIEKHPSWAHLDIAGVVMTDNEYSKGRSATAFGVLLLKEWIESIIN